MGFFTFDDVIAHLITITDQCGYNCKMSFKKPRNNNKQKTTQASCILYIGVEKPSLVNMTYIEKNTKKLQQHTNKEPKTSKF